MLGAAIGEICGTYGESWLSGAARPQKPPSSWGNLVVRGTEGLIRHGKLDLADWQESPPVNAASVTGKDADRESNAASWPHLQNMVGSGIIATVPVALFFHEDEDKLRQNLQQVADVWQDDSVLKDGTLAVGYAIALALKEKLDPATVIPLTLAYLDVETPLVQQLRQVQTFLEEGASLETVMTSLTARQAKLAANTPIAFAFYCFLSTLEDLRLSVVRATRCPQPQITSAIVGALSGAYNSIAGMPVGWRLALGKAKEGNSPLTELWGINSEAELLRLAARLLAAWSGVYDAEKFLIDPTQVPTVAAPNAIKPR